MTDDDKLEMQSLKAVEAEYLYRKVDDGTGKALSDVSAEKKKISLEAFQIIKVIGKGKHFFFSSFSLHIFILYF
jgi:hypothetical protein